MPNSLLDEFLDLLEERTRIGTNPKKEGRPFRYGTFEALLLSEGRVWGAAANIKKLGISPDPEKRCWENATVLADRRGLVYVEGFAAFTLPIPLEHAWCADRHANADAIDNTGSCNTEAVYLGLPFTSEYRIRAQRKAGRWQLLTTHNPVGVSLLRDGPQPGTLADVGTPIAEYMGRRH